MKAYQILTFLRMRKSTYPMKKPKNEADEKKKITFALLVPVSLPKVDSQVLLAYCSHEEAQYLFSQASEVGLLGPGYIWILPSLAVGNPNSPPPISFPVGLIGVITDNWRKTLGQRVREGVAIVAKGAQGFKKYQGFVPEGHSDCNTPTKHWGNNTLYR